MGRVAWTEPALEDLREIVDFIGKDSWRYALKLADRIMAATRSLANQQRSGGRVPEFDVDSVREIIVRPYRVIYQIREDDCYIVAVIHGARDLRRIVERPDP